MDNLELVGRQVMMLNTQLELAQRQNDVNMQERILKQLKSIADTVVDNNESMNRFLIYINVIKSIYEIYFERENYIKACDIAIESLVKMEPLMPYMDQERPATMLSYHLGMAAWGLYQIYSKIHERLSDKQIELIQLVSELYSQSISALCKINPTHPLLEGFQGQLQELRYANLLGKSDCSFLILSIYMINVEALWGEVKLDFEKMFESSRDSISSFEVGFDKDFFLNNIERFGIKDFSGQDLYTIDRIVSPLFNELGQRIDYNILLSDLYSLSNLSAGLTFLISFSNFSYGYSEYCRAHSEIPKQLSALYINDVFPYCPSALAKRINTEIRNSFLSLENTFGVFSKILTEQIDNDDSLLDVAENTKDENLQLMIISIVENNIEAEGVRLFNERLYLKALQYNDSEIVVDLNEFVERIKDTQILTDLSFCFSAQMVKNIFSKLQITM